jgi:hypothetical protein
VAWDRIAKGLRDEASQRTEHHMHAAPEIVRHCCGAAPYARHLLNRRMLPNWGTPFYPILVCDFY